MESELNIIGRRQAFAMPPPLTPEEIAFDNASQILAITGTFFAAAAFVVLLRCYVRISMLKVFGIDDYVMLFAMVIKLYSFERRLTDLHIQVICAATFTCFKLRCDYGLGRHMMVILTDPVMFMKLTKVQYVQAIIIMVGISAVKISIALQLLRLSVQRTYSRILYGAVVFIILMTLACAGTLIFQCLPIQAAWDSTLRPPPYGTGTARCYSLDVFRNLGLMNSGKDGSILYDYSS
jgi:hypothetical protein